MFVAPCKRQVIDCNRAAQINGRTVCMFVSRFVVLTVLKFTTNTFSIIRLFQSYF